MTSLQTKYSEQLNDKKMRLSTLLASYFNKEITVFESEPEHYRMRAEFRIWHEGSESFHIMFDPITKNKYTVVHLPAASKLINKAMQKTIAYVNEHECLRKKLFQIDYLSTTTNELIVSLIYHKALDEKWQQHAEALQFLLSDLGKINIIGRSKKQKLVIGKDYAIEALTLDGTTFTFKQVENSFTQPNAQINVSMLEWTMNRLSSHTGDLLELYCGAGNFSIPLAKIFEKVFATEISKSSVNAAQHNIKDNEIENLTIARLSSEEFTEAYNGTRQFFRLKDINLEGYNFTTVLVDPPRAGLDLETLNLISRFETIVYISCNPNTLAENLSVLDTSHYVCDIALFDQFPFTEHIETGVILKKRAS